MSIASVGVEQRVRLSDVPWDTYVSFTDGLGERPIRVTYDRGEMEIMTISPEHRNRKKRLGRLVEALTEEMAIDVASFGSMTCRREDLQRGLEGDESYWIANEPMVRGREHIDLDHDPPPDLFLEIEVSRGTLDRLAMLAALRIPEVWCFDGAALRVYLLTPEGAYVPGERSRAFPFLPLDEFAQFLRLTDQSETQLVRSFRAWVRTKMSAGWR